MPPRGKPTLCIDFDGVIHDYKAGWQGGEIYGDVTPGFFEWAQKVYPFFRLVVYSSRSKDEQQRNDMAAWISRKLHDWYDDNSGNYMIQFEYASEKPAAWLTIDDRCIRFDGNWGDESLSPEKMLEYLPWMNRPPEEQK